MFLLQQQQATTYRSTTYGRPELSLNMNNIIYVVFMLWLSLSIESDDDLYGALRSLKIVEQSKMVKLL
tara:strand:- start:190 stop:393 length:204 start_codon:yes stop_codon:yes gene_type:complete